MNKNEPDLPTIFERVKRLPFRERLARPNMYQTTAYQRAQDCRRLAAAHDFIALEFYGLDDFKNGDLHATEAEKLGTMFLRFWNEYRTTLVHIPRTVTRWPVTAQAERERGIVRHYPKRVPQWQKSSN